MSTKIYNGYMTKETDMVKLLNDLIEARKIIDEEKKKHVRYIGKTAIEKIKSGNKMFYEFKKDIEEFFNFEFEVTLFPMYDKTLMIIFSGNVYNKATARLVKALKLKDYCYYDNTDRPDRVSDRMWNKRKNDWEKVLLNDDAVPAHCGLSIRLADKEVYYTDLYTEKEIEGMSI
jgi:hypothetical protein